MSLLCCGPTFMKQRIASVIFVLMTVFCHAQEVDKIDSLKKVISSLPQDTARVDKINDLSTLYLGTNPDTALIYANQAKELADKINYQDGIAWALKRVGQVHNIKGDYVNSLQAWKEALAIFEKTNNKKGTSNLLNNIGVIFYNRSLEDSAQDYYLRSLKVAEEINDTLRIGTALANVGGVYTNKPATFVKALEYLHRALNLYIAISDSASIGISHSSIGYIYLEKAIQLDTAASDSLVKAADIDSSLSHLLAAQLYIKASDDLAYTLNNIAKVYREMKQYDLAIQYNRQAYDEAKKVDARLVMAQSLLGIAQIDTSRGDYKSALPVYKDAEVLLRQIGLDESYDLVVAYEGLAQSYAHMKDFANAFVYQSLLINLKNDIYNYEVDKKLSTKLFAFDIGKKQGEVDLQKAIVGRQKLIRNGFIGGFAVVLLFAGVFFTQRNRISKEKKRSDELLLNILPAETAEELKATGTAKAKSFDMVSVLFTDFKNFTQASEKLSPEELVAEINHCYSEFDKIITQHGIEKIKTIGDAYMCAGGLPATNTTNPVDVVQAGLDMVAFIEKNKQERIAKGQPFFELRCGVHTGPVVAGIVGIKKFAYDIWGDTVNTASRMESSGEIGRVNISGSTYDLVKDKFHCIHRGKVKAKNKGEIDMYFVEGRNS